MALSDVREIVNAYHAANDIVDQIARLDPLCARVAEAHKKGYADPTYSVSVALASGVSATAASAYANATGGGDVKHIVEFQTDTGFLRLPEKDILLGQKGGPGALVGYFERQYEKLMAQMKRRYAYEFYEDGSGQMGQITAISGSTITVASAHHVRMWSQGMKAVFAATRLGALRAAGPLTVLTTDAKNKTITFTAAVAAPIAVGDFVFVEGDAANGGAPKRGFGLQKFLEPTPGVLWNVNRALYPRHLIAGTYSDQTTSSGSFLDRVIDGMRETFANADHMIEGATLVCSAKTFAQIGKEQSQLQIVSSKPSTYGHNEITMVLGDMQAKFTLSQFVSDEDIFIVSDDPKDMLAVSLHGTKMIDECLKEEGASAMRDLTDLNMGFTRYTQIGLPVPSKFGWIKLPVTP